jgi:UDP-N-acetyl-2-amino-2-deoxyglucuronate dehydrogenase
VLNPWNIDALEEIERETGKRVYNVLQLRLHPAIRALRDRFAARIATDPTLKVDVDLAYITSRGRWYQVSWKGDESKSGGIATNIGVHFFDMLQWVFGPVQENHLHLSEPSASGGYLELEHARVRWFLSIDERSLPAEVRAKGQRTFRSIRVEGEELEFSEGFTDLHTESYRDMLRGQGFGLADARPAVQLVHDLRHATVRRQRTSILPLAASWLKDAK